MSNSISIKRTDEGFVPQLVITRKDFCQVMPVGTPIVYTTETYKEKWKEAWKAAKLSRTGDDDTSEPENEQDI